jgi:2-polyprenyl-3-methyl-5-hydroxy-6-metoxy-1,4-benzoquinol methylase
MSTTEAPAAPQEAFAERMFGALISTMELACVHIGDRLGLYAALDEGGPQTSAELAARAGVDERYCREWLEQQAAAAVLEVEDADAPAPERRFRLPEGHREGLLDPDSLLYAGAMARIGMGVLHPLDAMIEAFRTGEGVPYPDFGPDTREGIAAFNRPMFVNQLAQEWLPAAPDLHERLRSAPSRIADVASGQGWSSVSLAAAYPLARVDAFDSDEASVAAARALAAEKGLDDRVRAFLQDASDEGLGGEYDLVTIFEALHDMAHPVEALRSARRMLAPGGSVVVADERVADRFGAPADEVERLNYGFSVLHCLAVGREDDHSACTGTVIRAETVERYAREAGFEGFEVLPIEHDFWRFYRLSR